MPNVAEASDGYVPPPRTGPKPFETVDPNVVASRFPPPHSGRERETDPNGPELPEGCEVTAIKRHGSSFWTQTVHLETLLGDGTPKSFFLKVARDEQGRRMMHGEFESMSTLYIIVPDFVPRPLAWGSYQNMEEVHFFLCDFQ